MDRFKKDSPCKQINHLHVCTFCVGISHDHIGGYDGTRCTYGLVTN